MPLPKAVEAAAPAKVNLALHITGQRPDGYHLIDSVVAFAPVHDHLRVRNGDTLSLAVFGPEAAGLPADHTNLVLRAAQALAPEGRAAITLTKHLPIASGIGGGSADGAAAVRALGLLWDLPDDPALADRLLALGADLPMCLHPHPLRARGIGDVITPVALPRLPALLANPRRTLHTAAVFAALAQRDNPPMPADIPAFQTAPALAEWLAIQRNDLQAPALSLAPEIGQVLDALAGSEGCLLSRMSGSGATCFALYPTDAAAAAAHAQLSRDHPGWWLADGALGDQTAPAAARLS